MRQCSRLQEFACTRSSPSRCRSPSTRPIGAPVNAGGRPIPPGRRTRHRSPQGRAPRRPQLPQKSPRTCANAVLAATGCNFRRLLAWLAPDLARLHPRRPHRSRAAYGSQRRLTPDTLATTGGVPHGSAPDRYRLAGPRRSPTVRPSRLALRSHWGLDAQAHRASPLIARPCNASHRRAYVRRARGERWRCGREAEGGGLLNRYRVVKPYRGFESLRLRQLRSIIL